MPVLRSDYPAHSVSRAAGGHRDNLGRSAAYHSFGEGGALRFQPVDKWRLAMATAVTVLALPFLLDQSGKGAPGLAVAPGAGAAAVDLADSLRNEPDTTEALPPNAAYVPMPGEGTTTSQEIVIAVPTSPPEGTKWAKGKAGYRTWQATANGRPCLFTGAPISTVLTITNLDNGKATTCMVANNADPGSGLAILLDSSVFQDIADLAEAPVPVRITWTAA